MLLRSAQRIQGNRPGSYRFDILLALAAGSLHGAEIRRPVEEEGGGEVTVCPAMLYGALDDLAEEGLIEEVEKEDVSPERVRREAEMIRVFEEM